MVVGRRSARSGRIAHRAGAPAGGRGDIIGATDLTSGGNVRRSNVSVSRRNRRRLLPRARRVRPGPLPPDSFKNLKVLPKNISQRALLDTMRGFALALGVRCVYCHVGKEGQPLDSVNFRSDDKRTKRSARVMMHMVMHINEEHLADVPDRPKPVVVVRCATCHRGIARPRLLDDDLALMLADWGSTRRCAATGRCASSTTAAAPTTSGSIVVNQLARAEQVAGRHRQRDRAAQAERRIQSRVGPDPVSQAEVSLQKGDTAAALAGYRDALAKDSTNMGARRRLAALGAGPRPSRAPRTCDRELPAGRELDRHRRGSALLGHHRHHRSGAEAGRSARCVEVQRCRGGHLQVEPVVSFRVKVDEPLMVSTPLGSAASCTIDPGTSAVKTIAQFRTWLAVAPLPNT